MANTLSGAEVREIRTALGLSVAQFATVLAVHPTTVSRWESSGPQPIPIEGVAWNVLAALRQRLGRPKTDHEKAKEVGQEVANALLVGGALLALFILLQYAVKEK